MKKYFLCLALLTQFAAHAGQITKVDSKGSQLWVSDFTVNELRISDSVCLFQNKSLLGCGTVNALTTQTAGVRITERKVTSFYAGAQVTLRKNTRSPATAESLTEKFMEPNKQAIADLGLGLTAGFNYFYPMLHLQIAVTRDWSIGIMPAFASYAQGTSSVRFYGGYLTATYYHTHYAFKGLNFEGGLGFFNLTATAGSISQSSSPFAAKATVGWRGKALVGVPLDLGLAAGVQYIFASTAPLSISFNSLLPLLAGYISYSF